MTYQQQDNDDDSSELSSVEYDDSTSTQREPGMDLDTSFSSSIPTPSDEAGIDPVSIISSSHAYHLQDSPSRPSSPEIPLSSLMIQSEVEDSPFANMSALPPTSDIPSIPERTSRKRPRHTSEPPSAQSSPPTTRSTHQFQQSSSSPSPHSETEAYNQNTTSSSARPLPLVHARKKLRRSSTTAIVTRRASSITSIPTSAIPAMLPALDQQVEIDTNENADESDTERSPIKRKYKKKTSNNATKIKIEKNKMRQNRAVSVVSTTCIPSDLLTMLEQDGEETNDDRLSACVDRTAAKTVAPTSASVSVSEAEVEASLIPATTKTVQKSGPLRHGKRFDHILLDFVKTHPKSKTVQWSKDGKYLIFLKPDQLRIELNEAGLVQQKVFNSLKKQLKNYQFNKVSSSELSKLDILNVYTEEEQAELHVYKHPRHHRDSTVEQIAKYKPQLAPYKPVPTKAFVDTSMDLPYRCTPGTILQLPTSISTETRKRPGRRTSNKYATTAETSEYEEDKEEEPIILKQSKRVPLTPKPNAGAVKKPTWSADWDSPPRRTKSTISETFNTLSPEKRLPKKHFKSSKPIGLSGNLKKRKLPTLSTSEETSLPPFKRRSKRVAEPVDESSEDTQKMQEDEIVELEQDDVPGIHGTSARTLRALARAKSPEIELMPRNHRIRACKIESSENSEDDIPVPTISQETIRPFDPPSHATVENVTTDQSASESDALALLAIMAQEPSASLLPSMNSLTTVNGRSNEAEHTSEEITKLSHHQLEITDLSTSHQEPEVPARSDDKAPEGLQGESELEAPATTDLKMRDRSESLISSVCSEDGAYDTVDEPAPPLVAPACSPREHSRSLSTSTVATSVAAEDDGHVKVNMPVPEVVVHSTASKGAEDFYSEYVNIASSSPPQPSRVQDFLSVKQEQHFEAADDFDELFNINMPSPRTMHTGIAIAPLCRNSSIPHLPLCSQESGIWPSLSSSSDHLEASNIKFQGSQQSIFANNDTYPLHTAPPSFGNVLNSNLLLVQGPTTFNGSTSAIISSPFDSQPAVPDIWQSYEKSAPLAAEMQLQKITATGVMADFDPMDTFVVPIVDREEREKSVSPFDTVYTK